MKTLARLIRAMAVLSLCACAGPMRYTLQDTPAYSLTLWLELPHALFDRDDVVAGCAEWRPKGVVCALAADKASADVVIGLSDEACIADKDGYRVLARAYRDSHIEFVADCFRRNGEYDRRMFRAVMTHEIGHVIGIWRHVPKKCDPGAPEGSLDRTVCGIAVMNPLHDDDVTFITVIDALAFDARSVDDSALTPLTAEAPGASAGSVPTCTYKVR